jgi:hypothetical protein
LSGARTKIIVNNRRGDLDVSELVASTQICFADGTENLWKVGKEEGKIRTARKIEVVKMFIWLIFLYHGNSSSG